MFPRRRKAYTAILQLRVPESLKKEFCELTGRTGLNASEVARTLIAGWVLQQGGGKSKDESQK